MPDKNLKNGNGMINGLNNNRGLTNGVGKSNGLVNGSSNNNHSKKGMMETPKGRLGAWTVIGIVLLLIFGAFGISSNLYKSVDWSKVSKYTDYDLNTISDNNINITKFAFTKMGDSFYFYIGFQGDFSKAGDYKNLAYVFIDNDSSMGTGYNTGYLGAEYLIKLVGNETVSGSLYKFSGKSSDEWNWSEIGGSSLKYSLNVVKGSVHLNVNDNAKLMVIAESGYVQDITPVVGIGKTSLLIVQEPDGDNSINVKLIPLLGKVRLANISFSITHGISLSGANVSGNTLSINQVVSNEERYHITVYPRDVTGKVEVGINDVDTNVPVTVWGNVFRKYFGKINNIVIDGCFEDWNALASFYTSTKTVDNPNIEIYQHSAYFVNGTFFYASVKGSMLQGNIAPELEKTVSHGGGGGTPVKIIKRPYDYANITIETRNNGTHWIEVYGFNGKIKTILYDGKESDMVKAAVGKNGNLGALEVQLTKNFKIISYKITMTDWSGLSDTTGIKTASGNEKGGSDPGINAPEFNFATLVMVIFIATTPVILRRRKH